MSNQNAAPKIQIYHSARTSINLISPKGRRIVFTHHSFQTSEKELIEYLNEEISQGLLGITKGDLVSAEATDPVAALREQIREEERAKLLAEKGGSPDASKSAQVDLTGASTANAKLSPVSSKQVAN